MSHPFARFLTVLALALLLGAPFGSTPAAASNCPTFPYTLPDNTPATLIAAVQCANQLSDENTVIDLNNQTITFTSGYQNGGQALPDLGSMTLRNGTLTRSAQATNGFRFFSTNGNVLRLQNITLNNGGGNYFSSPISGGAIYHDSGVLVLTNSTLTNNVASFGGALYLGGTSTIQLRIINSTLSNNQASVGGALYSEANNSNGNGPQTEIFNSTLSANQTASSSNASALHVRGSDLSIYNSVLSGNSGGPAIKGNGDINVRNTTIAGNYAASGTGGVEIVNDPYVSSSSLTLANSILWDNSGSADYILPQGNSSVLTGSTIESSNDQNPLFVSGITPSATPSTSGNFRLSAGSPAINSGDNGFIQTDVYDIDGDSNASEGAPDRDLNPRIVNTTVDRGAYEFVQQPGITLNKTTVSVTEGGATDTYTVVLDSQPTANVTVMSVGSGNVSFPNAPSEVSFSAPQVVFTTANWNVPQTITVTAVDDTVVEGAHTSTIMVSSFSNDANYDDISGGTITANITDNDQAAQPGVTFTGVDTSSALREATGNTDTYTIQLATTPVSGSVTITITPDADCQIGVGGGSYGTEGQPLSIATDNSATVFTVSVRAFNDNRLEANHTCTISYAFSAPGDSAYNTLTRANDVYPITDDEVGDYGMVYLPSPTLLNFTSTSSGTEATTPANTVKAFFAINGTGSGSYGFDFPFTVDYSVTGGTATNGGVDYNLVAGSVTFDPNTAIFLFNVTSISVPFPVVDDLIDEADETIFITAGLDETGTSGGYDTAIFRTSNPSFQSHIYTITDNDDPGITLSKTSMTLVEGGDSDTYTVRLNTQPTQNVTVIREDPVYQVFGVQTTTTPEILTFTPQNWDVPQTFTVNSVNDSIEVGDRVLTITHSVSTSDASYSALSTVPSLTVNLFDDDAAGATVSPTSVNVTEGGASTTYTMVLDTNPYDGYVEVTFTPDAQVTVSPMTLSFNSGNWDVPQTVTVTAVDDALIEGAHTGTVFTSFQKFGSQNVGYVPDLGLPGMTVNIADNDALPSNLLLNNGFETPLGNDWVGTSLLATDRRMCNGGAFAGACMFRFSSSAASTTTRTLRQTVVSSGWGVAGDTLNFAAQAQAIGFTGAMRMVIEVTYTDDTTARQRVVLPTGSYAYAQQVVSIVLTKPLASVTVSFEARNDTGIMRFDNARLRLIPGASSGVVPLALPPAQ